MAAVGGIIFGTSAALVGTIIDDVDPLRLSALRIAIAGLCLLPWAIMYRSAIARAPVRVAIVGVLQIVLNAFFYTSLERIGVGPAVGLEFLAPVLIVVWDRVVGHAHPRPVTWMQEAITFFTLDADGTGGEHEEAGPEGETEGRRRLAPGPPS